MTPAIKYLVTKSTPSFIYETLECLGGNGYVEDLATARLYREAPLNAISEGSGTVVALDVLRVLRRDRDTAQAVIDGLANICGGPGKAAAEAINQSLDREDRDSHARIVAEKLGRLGVLAALHESNGSLAESYAATRLQGVPHATFGACDLQAVQSLILARLLPP